MKYLFQAIGCLVLFVLAMPFFILGALLYVPIGFPFSAGWAYGHDSLSSDDFIRRN